MEKQVTSKVVSLLSKKEKAFCGRIKLSQKDSSRFGAFKRYLLKKKIRIGQTEDFSKVEGMKGALGTKERKYLVKFMGVDVEPLSYAKSEGESGINFKKIVKAKYIKA